MMRIFAFCLFTFMVAGCGVQGPLYRTDMPKADAPSPQPKEMKRKERHQTYGELSNEDQHILPDLLY